MTGPSPGILNKCGNHDGFTLAELMIVVVIIGILVTIAVPAFLGQRTKAMRSEAMTNLESLRLLQEQYYAEAGTYTGNAGTCGADNNNISDIQVELPGFKPGDGASLYFSYCLITNTTIDGTDTTAGGSPYDCFTAQADGNSSYSAIAGTVLKVDCDNDKSY